MIESSKTDKKSFSIVAPQLNTTRLKLTIYVSINISEEDDW